MLPLRGSFDVVAFVSEPDSMISPSEGVDGDLDLRDAMVILPGSLRDPGDELKRCGLAPSSSFRDKRSKSRLARTFPTKRYLGGMY